MRRRPPARLEILTIYRGIAATLVVLFHYLRIAPLPSWTPMLPPDKPIGFFEFGHSGVDFFFVVSGFVMVWGYWHEAGDPRRLWPYLKARCARIYPTYWAVFPLTALYLWTHPQVNDAALAPDALFRAALLYPPGPFLVPPSGTLPYELVCYLGFAALFVVGPTLFCVAALVWCGAVLAQWYDWTSVADSLWMSPRVLEWFLGAAGALFVLRVRPHVSALWLTLSAVAVLVMAVVDDVGIARGSYHDIRNFALPYLLVIVAGAGYELAAPRRYPWLLVLLGEASYSIYLTHFYLIRIVVYPVYGHPIIAAWLGSTVQDLVVLTIVLAGGVACWAVIERPLLRRSRRFVGTRPHVRSAGGRP